MKSIVYLLLLFNCTFLSAQKLRGAEKREVKSQLREMEKRDQQYRVQIKKTSLSPRLLWKLQSVNDSINKVQFAQLIDQYGYPSQERVGLPTTVFLSLHFTLEDDFIAFHSLFEEEMKAGRMPVMEYARWYDRCQMNKQAESMFGTYGQKEFCGEELLRVNKNRATLNLPELEPTSDCP